MIVTTTLRRSRNSSRSARRLANVANLIGYSYRKLGDYELSQAWYERALKSDPNHVLTWKYYGLWQSSEAIVIRRNTTSAASPPLRHRCKEYRRWLRHWKSRPARSSPTDRRLVRSARCLPPRLRGGHLVLSRQAPTETPKRSRQARDTPATRSCKTSHGRDGVEQVAVMLRREVDRWARILT